MHFVYKCVKQYKGRNPHYASNSFGQIHEQESMHTPAHADHDIHVTKQKGRI